MQDADEDIKGAANKAQAADRGSRGRLTKWLRRARYVVLGLVCLQFVTYFTLADRFLVHVAMRCRPELTHFGGNPNFKWVCLCNVNTEAVGPEIAQAIKDAFKRRYETVYYDTRDIPEESIMYRTVDGKRKRTGYRDGYLYTIVFRSPGFMNIIVSHSDYEANLAAYSRQGWHFWMWFWWVRVHTCYAEVS